MEARTNEEQTVQDKEVSTYTILAYPGCDLPKNYKNMVFSKFLRQLRFGNDYFKLIDSDAYYSVYHKYIELILARPNTVVRIAALTEDVDTVFGFSIVEGSALHFVYVHKDQRNQGIATSLIPQPIEYITHLTKVGMAIWNSKLPNAKFNPFI